MQFFKDLNVAADQKKFFKKALNSYYDAVAELLQSEHAVTPFLCFWTLLFVIWFSLYIHA